MNNSIQPLFQSHFDYRTYSHQIVHDVFGCNDIEQTLDDPIDTSAAGDKSYYIGQMEDSDHQLLGFFYTRTAEGSDVRRKRVGWRKLISPYLKYHVDAAVAVFDDGQHWRLSYICDQKESLTAAKRFSYVMGDAAGQYKTPVARLGRVAACRGRFALSDIFEAFSVEALSNQFFDEYRNYYADIVEDLTGKRMVKAGNNWVEKVIHAPLQSVYDQLDGVEDADKMVRDYVKKLLGRIVFLHFLQKKGWLNGNPAFLSDLFFMQPLDRKADFLEKVLEPLFFGIFNTERADREKLFAEQGWDMELLEQWRDLPYLNGGLFERDEVDKVHVKLPEQRFKKLFEFLASYNFTVDENDPDDAEVGVDPEMLGKIFESLLEDNKSKGAFYTPKEIVRYMCKESLIAYLVSKVENSGGLQDASERQDAQNANNPTQESGKLSQCGGGGDDEKCVSETRDRMSNGRDSGGLPDAPERLNAQRANNPTQGTQCGDNDSDEKCVSETRDLKAIIRQFVEQHELPAELEPYRETLDAALRNVKICDPAIGSGAFPMGLLNELWRCREALQDTPEGCDFNNPTQEKCGDCDRREQTPPIYSQCGECAVTSTESPLRARGTRPQSRVDLKKEIIENNIYGVDIERGAIDIARLRFWLSIVVDAEEPEPLPNFDYKFMQGNSLIESFEGHDLSRIMDTRPLTGRGTRRAGWAENQTGMDFSSDDTRQNLRIWLKKYFSLTDHKEKAHYRELINSSVKSYIKQQSINPAIEVKLDKLDPSANQDFFLWHTWFKDIFDNGGFDIVIGNPPYINIANLTDDYARVFYQRNYKTVKNKCDLYSIFAERAHGLLKTKGICSFIFSNSWLGTDSFSLFREFLVNETTVIKLVDLPDKVFENATVKTCIILFSKNKANNHTVILENYDGNVFYEMDHSLTYKNIKRYDNFPFSFEKGIDLSKVKVVALGDIAEFSLGIKTSNDKKFISNSPFPEDNYRLIRGRNIQRYNTPLSYEWIWYRPDLFMEKVGAGPRKLGNFLVKQKILIQDIAQEICATIDSNMYLCNDTINLIFSIDNKFKFEYILGLLNSKPVRFWHKKIFPEGLHIKIYQLKEIPIPVVSFEKQDTIVDLVKQILLMKKSNPNADTSSLEREIDKLVYQLYHLTPEEIAIIEQ